MKLTILLYLSLVGAELLHIKNNSRNNLTVSITGLEDFILPPNKSEQVTVPDDFSGGITAVPSDHGDVEVPRTLVQLILSPVVDTYDVSLVDGFNIKAKITPLKGRRCKTAMCTSDINSMCSLRHEIKTNTDIIVGCYNSPFLFKGVCPKAVVTSADVRNVFACTTDAYLITLG